MADIFILRLLVLLSYGSLVSGYPDKACNCKVPTPCKTQEGCAIPTISNISLCESGSHDCRDVKQSERTLCSWKVDAKDNFCCWTDCSSMRMKRTCGDAPGGFTFEYTGKRDGRDCKHILNVREECCLHENHIMGAIKPKDGHCPKLGEDLAEIFATVDGNRANAPNKFISATEVLNSLKWLDSKGYIFLAKDFAGIDADKNHKISWYELELFCGHRAQRLPPEDLLQVKPNDITTFLSNPLMLAALLSSFVVGEVVGLCRVIYNHVLGNDTQGSEEFIIRIVYTFVSFLWPMTYSAFQIYYYIWKIQWEVCDFSDGMIGVQEQYILWVGASTLLNANVAFLWVRRRLPTSPSKDLERRIYMQQALFLQQHRWYEKACLAFAVFVAVYTVNRAIFYGTIFDVDFPGIEKCKREDPDLALLYDVNERFILWKILQNSVIFLYIQLGWGIQNKNEYTRLPARETDKAIPSKDERSKIQDMVNEERTKWEWFA